MSHSRKRVLRAHKPGVFHCDGSADLWKTFRMVLTRDTQRDAVLSKRLAIAYGFYSHKRPPPAGQSLRSGSALKRLVIGPGVISQSQINSSTVVSSARVRSKRPTWLGLVEEEDTENHIEALVNSSKLLEFMRVWCSKHAGRNDSLPITYQYLILLINRIQGRPPLFEPQSAGTETFCGCNVKIAISTSHHQNSSARFRV